MEPLQLLLEGTLLLGEQGVLAVEQRHALVHDRAGVGARHPGEGPPVQLGAVAEDRLGVAQLALEALVVREHLRGAAAEGPELLLAPLHLSRLRADGAWGDCADKVSGAALRQCAGRGSCADVAWNTRTPSRRAARARGRSQGVSLQNGSRKLKLHIYKLRALFGFVRACISSCMSYAARRGERSFWSVSHGGVGAPGCSSPCGDKAGKRHTRVSLNYDFQPVSQA